MSEPHFNPIGTARRYTAKQHVPYLQQPTETTIILHDMSSPLISDVKSINLMRLRPARSYQLHPANQVSSTARTSLQYIPLPCISNQPNHKNKKSFTILFNIYPTLEKNKTQNDTSHTTSTIPTIPSEHNPVQVWEISFCA